MGVVKLIDLLNLLGITLQTGQAKRSQNALTLVGQTASVSCKNMLDSFALAKALVAGELPTNIFPYIATLLDEAPLPLIVRAIEEIATDYNLPLKSLWKNVNKWNLATYMTKPPPLVGVENPHPSMLKMFFYKRLGN